MLSARRRQRFYLAGIDRPEHDRLLLHRLEMLRSAIVGAGKSTIAAALGPPRAMTRASGDLVESIWYYRIDPQHGFALAIEFENDIAQHATLLQSPVELPQIEVPQAEFK